MARDPAWRSVVDFIGTVVGVVVVGLAVVWLIEQQGKRRSTEKRGGTQPSPPPASPTQPSPPPSQSDQGRVGTTVGGGSGNDWSTTASPLPPLVDPPPSLQRGDRGDVVRKLQEDLAQLGFNPGPADAIFGAKTEDAVRLFQRAEGMPDTGVADGNLQRLLAARAGANTMVERA